jgi:hypothetical protein
MSVIGTFGGGISPTSANAAETKPLVGQVSAAHPRILGSPASFAALKLAASSDPVLAGLLERVRSKSETIKTQPVFAFPASRSSMYGISQNILDRVSTLSISWQLTGNSSFADRMWAELQSSSSFPDWNTGHFLDTATMAEAFAIGYDSAYAYWTPAQRVTLQNAIAGKALSPALAAYQASDAWTNEDGNWNVVSNAGIGMAALAINETHPQLASDVLKYSLGSLQNGLSGFAPGGGYREGPQYWSYAIQHLMPFALALRYSTGNDQGIFASPGMSQTARMSYYAASPTGVPFNYSDSTLTSYITPALLVLGAEYGDPVATKIAYDATQTSNINQFSLLWYKPSAAQKTPAQAGMPLDTHMSGAEVVSMRSAWDQRTALYTAMKSATTGSNGHPELDAGTFVLSASGVDWASELGPDNYSLPGYLNGLEGAERWQFYRKRAEGNNTLVVNPGRKEDQKTNADATISRFESSPERAFAISDMTAVLPGIATSWQRGIELTNHRQDVVIQDEIRGAGALDLWWGMHTEAGISISADGRTATLTKNGEQMLARLASPAGATFMQSTAVPLWSSPTPAGQANNSGINKLRVHISGSSDTTLSIQFTPIKAGIPTTAVLPVESLSSWAVGPTPTATLASLSVGNAPIQGFSPSTLIYDAFASPQGSAPIVTATAPEGTKVVVTQAATIPGTASIVVSKPGSPDSTYRVQIQTGATKVVNATSSTTWAAAQATIDGNVITKWVGGGNQSLQYDFGTVANLSKLRIKWASSGATPTKFGIVYRNDAGRWITLYSSSVPSNSDWSTLSFPGLSARYFGLIIDNQGVATQFSGIHEIEFYRDSGAVNPVPSVRQPASAQVSGVPADLRVGDSGQIAYKVMASDGTQSVPASSYGVAFASSAPSVLKVDSATGQYTVISAGTAMVGAEVTSGGRSYVSAGTFVNVTNPWTTSSTPTTDTYVNNSPGASSTNYGTSAALFVKSHSVYTTVNREAYMSFDLSRYSGKQIVSAKITFYGNVTDSNGTAIDVDLHSITGPWNEQTVTYATKPALGPRIGGASLVGTLASYEVDVTDYIKAQQSVGSAGVAFTEDTPPNGSGLLAIIYGKDTPKKPVLTVQTAYEPR